MKTNLHKEYGVDENLEKEGIWHPVSNEVSFLVARYGGSNQFKKLEEMSKVFNPYTGMMAENKLSEEKQNELLITAFVKTSILDVKGLKDADTGEDIEFSEQVVIDILMQYRELANDIIGFANERTNYISNLGN